MNPETTDCEHDSGIGFERYDEVNQRAQGWADAVNYAHVLVRADGRDIWSRREVEALLRTVADGPSLA